MPIGLCCWSATGAAATGSTGLLVRSRLQRRPGSTICTQNHSPCVLKPLKALREVTVAAMLVPCLLTPPGRLLLRLECG